MMMMDKSTTWGNWSMQWNRMTLFLDKHIQPCNCKIHHHVVAPVNLNNILATIYNCMII